MRLFLPPFPFFFASSIISPTPQFTLKYTLPTDILYSPLVIKGKLCPQASPTPFHPLLMGSAYIGKRKPLSSPHPSVNFESHMVNVVAFREIAVKQDHTPPYVPPTCLKISLLRNTFLHQARRCPSPPSSSHLPIAQICSPLLFFI